MKATLIVFAIAISAILLFFLFESHFESRPNTPISQLEDVSNEVIDQDINRELSSDNRSQSQKMAASRSSNENLKLKNQAIITATDMLDNDIYITVPTKLKTSDFIFEEGLLVDEGFVETYPMATNMFIKIIYPDSWNPNQKNISIKFQSNFDLLYGYSSEDEAFKILPFSVDKVTGNVKFRISSKRNEIIFGLTKK